MPVSVLTVRTQPVHTVYRQCIGGTGVEFQGIHFLEARNHTRMYIVLHVKRWQWPTDHKILTLFPAETCEVKNVKSQKYPSNTSQDTQNNLHSSSSDLAFIIDPSKLSDWYEFSAKPLQLKITIFFMQVWLQWKFEFWVISLHCNQTYRQKVDCCSSKLHLTCGWLQPQLHCL